MVFQRGGHVYILANKYNSVLYIGVTSELISRVWQHKNKSNPGSFTSKYNCNKLVYYAGFNHIEEAIAEEKRLKGSNREYKRRLISEFNSEWKDLYQGLIDE
ncbi:GIY-YIG nuclease family protein [Mucilaginibacter terrenus]|uniref:GIY-YIG nuclease family protein n=1 Tax=Mucilaginibacter terrenus TaxID=2482727 RepID=A0A3E2NQS1_9SPHI|nr:GIY-YIG nuclease family protein [Mucilaginibacter terrenus]RFZ83230.1 GIY-YIG nuclease family protein [Mucilaginibacter terrenus]